MFEVPITVRPRDRLQPCPCGSGRRYRQCCELQLRAAVRTPPTPHSGHRHPRCYAGALEDCSDTISREHPISAGVIGRLAFNGKVDFENRRFQPDGSKLRLKAPAIAAKILCTRHNTALSDLDQLAETFVHRLEQIARTAFGDRRYPGVELFNGLDLERWMLKLVAGHCAAGWALEEGKVEVPREWLDVIWGSAVLEPPNGFYCITESPPPGEAGMYGYEHKPFFARHPTTGLPVPQGGTFNLLGFRFALQAGAQFDVRAVCGGRVRYRPTHLDFVGSHARVLTELDYGDGENRRVTAEMSGQVNEGPKPDVWNAR